jgi:hypothetical protein
LSLCLFSSHLVGPSGSCILIPFFVSPSSPLLIPFRAAPLDPLAVAIGVPLIVGVTRSSRRGRRRIIDWLRRIIDRLGRWRS